MSLSEYLFGNGVDVAKAYPAFYREHARTVGELDDMRHELREVQEDLLKISDAFDNIGWAPLDKDEAVEIPLKTVKEIAEVARAMQSMNPFVKSGIEARIGYIWGKGVTFENVADASDKYELNYKKLFSPTAFAELERALATDGNVFTAIPIELDVKATPDDDEDVPAAFRVPLNQITNIVANPNDPEEIWYFKREWSVKTINQQTGQPKETKYEKYYVSMPYAERLKKTNRSLPRNRNKVGVEQNYVMHHMTVNKQVGWRWGLPDITSVIFWAKAYKEYLEDNTLLVKAYSRLAWTYKADTAGAGANAAANIMTPPRRDSKTGELRDVGGTALYSGGQLTPAPATGSQVDFDKGSALASAIAAGLEIPKQVITRDPGEGTNGGAESLDLPTLKAMENRQLLHAQRFLDIFEYWGIKIRPDLTDQDDTKDVSEAETDFQKPKSKQPDQPKYAVVTFPQIQTDTTKDRITALGTATELGILYKQEARKEALDVLNIAPYKPWDELPTMEDDPAAQEKFQQAQQQAQQEFENQSAIAKQGVSGGVAAKGGSQSTANQARTARKKDTGNS